MLRRVCQHSNVCHHHCILILQVNGERINHNWDITVGWWPGMSTEGGALYHVHTIVNCVSLPDGWSCVPSPSLPLTQPYHNNINLIWSQTCWTPPWPVVASWQRLKIEFYRYFSIDWAWLLCWSGAIVENICPAASNNSIIKQHPLLQPALLFVLFQSFGFPCCHGVWENEIQMEKYCVSKLLTEGASAVSGEWLGSG